MKFKKAFLTFFLLTAQNFKFVNCQSGYNLSKKTKQVIAGGIFVLAVIGFFCYKHFKKVKHAENCESFFSKTKNGKTQNCLKKNYNKSLKPAKSALKSKGDVKAKKKVSFDLDANESCSMNKKDNANYLKHANKMHLNDNFPGKSTSTLCLGKVLQKDKEE